MTAGKQAQGLEQRGAQLESPDTGGTVASTDAPHQTSAESAEPNAAGQDVEGGTPTPLVDAVVFIQPDLNLQVVDADFARRLERETVRLRERLKSRERFSVFFEAQYRENPRQTLAEFIDAWRESFK